jgi:hypothetical protein
MRDSGASYLKRLAFFTMPDSGKPTFSDNSGWPRLKLSEGELIDVITPLNENNVQSMKRALLCYETYQEMVEKTGVIDKIGNKVHFEIALEQHDPPLKKITAALST